MQNCILIRLGHFAIMAALSASLALSSRPAAADDHTVVFMAASSQNGFNQAIWNGVKKRAEKIGHVKVDIFDGEFNATKQYNQIEDLATSKKYQGMIIVPNDPIGIANAVKDAVDAGIKVATALFAIGPKLDTLEPQIPGLVATVASNPAVGARAQAEAVAKFCENKNPCNVVIIIGFKIFPYDNFRLQTFLDTLKPHANVKVIATLEGAYDVDKSMSGMQDVLQAHKDIDAILSSADQHVAGAVIAMKDAGLDLKKVYLMGAGASELSVKEVREGRWQGTLAYFPETQGEYALQAVVDSLNGKKVDPAIDSDKIGPLPALVTKAVLDQYPNFIGEWVQ